jgi:hypothetical protein
MPARIEGTFLRFASAIAPVLNICSIALKSMNSDSVGPFG